MIKNKFYILLFLMLGTVVFAQQKPVQATVDSTKIKIGSQFNLTLKTTVDSTTHVYFPDSKTFGYLEVLESYPVDTIKKANRYELIKRYGLTQFDTGKYTVPQLPVIINNKQFLTDSLAIQVMGVVVDTTKQQMYDIKPVITVKKPISNVWKYSIILALIIGAGFLVNWLLKRYQNKDKKVEEIYATPIEKATNLLQNLEKKELWQNGDVKSYYSEMTDITRTYIEETIQVPAMESTTAELLAALKEAVIKKKMGIKKDTFETFEKILKNADLVKFAKSKPLDFEIASDRKNIEGIIFTIEKSIPKEVEQAIVDERLRQERIIKQQKVRRILISTATSIVLFIAAFTYFLSTDGLDFIKDKLIGHSTKDLLQGEWVKSEYGEPSVIIETPKVLKRFSDERVQTNLPANIKSTQKFLYGSLIDNFSIAINTTTFKDSLRADNDAILNENIARFEKTVGAKGIIVKTDDFEIKDGFTGKRGYGTMTIFNPAKNEDERMEYQIIIFSQKFGIQEIALVYREGDENAKEIADRIVKSIELRKVTE